MIGQIPTKSPVLNKNGWMADDWVNFYSSVFDGISALQSSGPTAIRPTSYLYVGRPYFDTTLNKPIWVSNDGATWVDATGTPV